MFQLFSAVWLSVDTDTDSDVGHIAYENGINGNKFMTITPAELVRIGFSQENGQAVIDGREVEYGNSCSCVTEAWFGPLGPGMKAGYQRDSEGMPLLGPRPSRKCLSALRVECMKDPTLAFCSDFDLNQQPMEYSMRDPTWPASFVVNVMDTLIDIASECGIPFVTRESFDTTRSMSQITEWDASTIALMMHLYGDQEMSMNALTNPKSGAIFFREDMDGERYMLLDAPSLTRLGFTDGSASSFVQSRNDFYGYYSWPPSDEYDGLQDVGKERSVNEQFNVSVTFVLDKLMNLDEPGFSFEVELTLMISWEDDRIFKRCDNTGVDGIWVEGDPCKLFWKPTLIWPNIILSDYPGATLQPSVVEDMGFSSRVSQGKDVTDPSQKSPGLETSVGFQKYKVRGSFETNFAFHKFPYDMQNLDIEVIMPEIPLRKAQFVARADSKPGTPGAGNLPLWETKCIYTSVDILDETSKGYSFNAAVDDPYSFYLQKIEDLSPMEMVTEKYTYPDKKAKDAQDYEVKEAIFEQYEKLSRITLTIQIQRLPDFYVWNFVLVVVLLVFVAFFSFAMEKSALGDRLGLTLTIVLGLNVFQIVIIDNMPATGYLTNMHTFLLMSTILVLVVAVENLIVYSANKRRTRLEVAAKAFMQGGKKTTFFKGLSGTSSSSSATAPSKVQGKTGKKEEVEMVSKQDILLGGPRGNSEAPPLPLTQPPSKPLNPLWSKLKKAGEC